MSKTRLVWRLAYKEAPAEVALRELKGLIAQGGATHVKMTVSRKLRDGEAEALGRE